MNEMNERTNERKKDTHEYTSSRGETQTVHRLRGDGFG